MINGENSTMNKSQLIAKGLKNPEKIIPFIYDKMNHRYQMRKYGENIIIDDTVYRLIQTDSAAGRIFVDPTDNIVSKSILNNGYWNDNMVKLFHNFVGEGDIIVDIGANIGFFTLLCSNIVGKNGEVIAFEPEKRNFDILSANMARNSKYDNIIGERLAISDKGGEISLYISENKGGHSIKDYNDTHIKSQTVSTIPLDQYDVSSPDVVKIDVEGAEPSVFEGMSNVLDAKPILFFEYSDDWESRRETLNMLKSIGYTFFHIEDNYNNVSIEDILEINGHINVFADTENEQLEL